MYKHNPRDRLARLAGNKKMVKMASFDCSILLLWTVLVILAVAQVRFSRPAGLIFPAPIGPMCWNKQIIFLQWCIPFFFISSCCLSACVKCQRVFLFSPLATVLPQAGHHHVRLHIYTCMSINVSFLCL